MTCGSAAACSACPSNLLYATQQGDSEEAIGKWLKKTGLRKEFSIATKFGFDENFNIRGDAQFVRDEFEKSSKKLDAEQIDPFYQHRPDPKTPIEVIVGAMAELVKWVGYCATIRFCIADGDFVSREGRVKYLGLSEASPSTIRRAHKVHPITAVQVEWVWRTRIYYLSRSQSILHQILAF